MKKWIKLLLSNAMATILGCAAASCAYVLTKNPDTTILVGTVFWVIQFICCCIALDITTED